VGPPWGHQSCQQTCSRWAPLSLGPQLLQDPAPAQVSHRVTAPFRPPSTCSS
ncbi:unnamed protein product, partial [Coccothraustes coccothraustes]